MSDGKHDVRKQNGCILPTLSAVENYKPFRTRGRTVHIITYLLYPQEVSAITMYTSETIRNSTFGRNFKQTCCLQATLAQCKKEDQV